MRGRTSTREPHVATGAAVEERGVTTAMPALDQIGHVVSWLTNCEEASKQGNEGAPPAWLVFEPGVQEGLRDLQVGEEILVLTWLDRADRDVLLVHPRDDPDAPPRGVFSTRSQDRPNPIGIHRVVILEIDGPTRIRVLDLEALDGTPIIDVKPVARYLRAVDAVACSL